MRLVVGVAVCWFSLGPCGTEWRSSSAVWAQARQEHHVQRLESNEVGPYRPERTPELEEVERMIVESTNEFRKQQDRDPVERETKLATTAQSFADYMARTDRYGHRADDRTPSERAAAHDYEYCIVAENIAYRFRTRGFSSAELARGLVNGWKESPGHRENMLDADVTQIGVAIAQSEKTGVFYAVQMFGRPESATIEFRLANRSGMDIAYRLGERKYTLPARFTRQHRECRPAELILLATTAANEAKPVARVKPADGESFVIFLEDGMPSIDREEAPASR